jgi:hypothetical protein
VDLSRVLEEELLHPRQRDLQDRDGARIQEPCVDLLDKGLGGCAAGDEHLFAFAGLDAVANQKPRQLRQPFVSQCFSSR